MTSRKKFLGIYVDPLYVQNEGLRQVFDNIESAGAHAVCFTPWLALPATDGRGTRFPDLHVDGFRRTVARPVWGKREIQLHYYRAYVPDLDLYDGCPYQPAAEPLPESLDHDIPQKMMAEAKRRGMQVNVEIHPTIPPNLRVEDQPRYIDGSSPQPPLVASSACLNSPATKAYGEALIRDTMQNYPEVDGLSLDWAEFGAYRFKDHFTCFCANCEREARRQGFDWDAILRDVHALWNWVHSLTSHELARSRRLLGNPSELLELLTHYPGCLYFLQFKSRSVVTLYRMVRQLLDDTGMDRVNLVARGWPPPWNRSSGMDYRALAQICTAVAPKLFTFDYSALPRWYGQELMAWNPVLTESELLDVLVDWMNLPDDIESRSFAHYNIPAPEERHPAKIEAYEQRLEEVTEQVRGAALCYPISHPYLPESQWRQMVATIRNSRVDGTWVNMYGYLSDAKFAILKQEWNGGP
jgi:hypothetical protein